MRRKKTQEPDATDARQFGKADAPEKKKKKTKKKKKKTKKEKKKKKKKEKKKEKEEDKFKGASMTRIITLFLDMHKKHEFSFGNWGKVDIQWEDETRKKFQTRLRTLRVAHTCYQENENKSLWSLVVYAESFRNALYEFVKSGNVPEAYQTKYRDFVEKYSQVYAHGVGDDDQELFRKWDRTSRVNSNDFSRETILPKHIIIALYESCKKWLKHDGRKFDLHYKGTDITKESVAERYCYATTQATYNEKPVKVGEFWCTKKTNDNNVEYMKVSCDHGDGCCILEGDLFAGAFKATDGVNTCGNYQIEWDVFEGLIVGRADLIE